MASLKPVKVVAHGGGFLVGDEGELAQRSEALVQVLGLACLEVGDGR